MCHVVKGIPRLVVFTLSKYENTYDKSYLQSMYANLGELTIKHFSTEQFLCTAFLTYLQELSQTTIVSFFYGSCAFVKKLTDKECEDIKKQDNLEFCNWYSAALKTDQQLGYDLPYIIDRSTQSLTIEKSVLKIESQVCTQIKHIKELPACIFYDAMFLLISELSPDQKNSMKRKGLNNFC